MDSRAFRPPIELTGRFVRLVPLARAHAVPLAAAGADPEIWTYLPYRAAGDEGAMRRLIDLLLERQASGTDLAFTILLPPDHRAIGMTRYLEIDRSHRRVEVGGTWLGRAFWRTPVNTDAKRLLLAHAFEKEGANRVQFKTDLRNLRSQRAIERLGAVREGVLRDHMIMPDGVVRSSVLYSVVAQEWPAVRARLDAALDRPWAPPQGS